MTNNIVTNFNQTLHFAKQYQLPITKKRAILREYLQTKILNLIYRQKESIKLSFVGGTALRLLYNLDRFSEDLDFDNLGLSNQQITKLIKNTHSSLVKENIATELYHSQKKTKSYFELRFPHLLYELNISTNPKEKLMIKLDYSHLWQNQKITTLLFNRYGYVFSIITNEIDQIFVQKIQAYLGRQQTQARDLYDIIWLINYGVKIDQDFVKKNKLKSNIIGLAQQKYQQERPKIAGLQRKLKPFLINESHISQLKFFLEITKK